MSASFHVWLSITLLANGSGAISVQASFDISFRGFTAIDFKHSRLDNIYCQEWNIDDRVILGGGIRNERIGLNVNDYTTFNER